MSDPFLKKKKESTKEKFGKVAHQRAISCSMNELRAFHGSKIFKWSL